MQPPSPWILWYLVRSISDWLHTQSHASIDRWYYSDIPNSAVPSHSLCFTFRVSGTRLGRPQYHFRKYLSLLQERQISPILWWNTGIYCFITIAIVLMLWRKTRSNYLENWSVSAHLYRTAWGSRRISRRAPILFISRAEKTMKWIQVGSQTQYPPLWEPGTKKPKRQSEGYQFLSVMSCCGDGIKPRLLVSLIRHNLTPSLCDQIVYRVERANVIPQCINIHSPPTQRERTRESEATIGKLVEDFDVAASPCYVGDSWYNPIHSISSIHPSTLIPIRAFARP